MSEGAASASEITITVKGPSELKLSITISTEKTVTELKEAIAAKSDVEKERQRLIYSGKVLKDEDAISTYKIQNGHTIHMVKGAAKNNNTAASSSAGSGSTPAAAPRLPQMGTGLNVGSNPIDNVENIHHGLAGFNPFAGQPGLDNMFDPNAMTGMMNNPEFMRSMADMMARPEVLDQIIASNPQLQAMGPQVRQMMQSPMFRQMMSNPETLRAMMQMNASMGGGQGGFGGAGGGFNPFGGGFGAAGAGAGGQTGGEGQNAPSDPFPNLFAPQPPSNTNANTANPSSPSANSPPSGNQAANPLAALFGGAGGAGAGFGGQGGGNPFGFDPSLLFGAGAGRPGAGFGGFGSPPPRDERPPEEMYATQLGQLNAMGLWDAQKNIRALRSTGGNVEAAIELIFSGQLD
ncbi:uncharacterized protein I303_103925 [Kwoniella dejecticola CBS 10117]|uniref:Ubiquilin n=1 Tax=Kwoniella dejecticola CBS 10117 TaxID=1296121 RepID=A0A1A6A839_9TREE|nr:ubiquilin [Kwoniella dejecticola CBS 10117]OBR86222.1 ubiquilin [Kwoniella dejecticola CBS 10117]